MPNYRLSLDEAIRNGLKRDSRVPRGTAALEQCDYLRPTEFGLKDFLPVTQPIVDGDLTPGGETWTYPYPQLFRGASVTLLCFSDAVYLVNESAWTATELTFYDAADFGDVTPGSATITVGGPWHFVDYHTTWVLFNGVTTIWNTGHYNKPLLTSAVTITTGCDLKGRFFMGGFDPTDTYALADWPTYWATLDDNAPAFIRTQAVALAGGMKSNWAWWGTIGGGDMLWLISKDWMTLQDDDGSYTADNPFWQELWSRNEVGACPLPWQGTILCQKRLGETVICYGDGGITALVPYSSPAAGMAPLDLHGIGMGVGIASRCAVGGSYDEHVFVDNAGELWRVGTDLVAQRIGYGYVFSDLLSYDILVHHDPHRREYYITGYNGSTYECYVLTSTGLGRAPWVPKSLHFLEGGLIGILQGSTAAGAEIITVHFGPEDGRSIDEVESVSLITEDTDTTGWTIYVQYRFDKADTFTNSTGVASDIRGYARMNVSGLEFRIRLTHPDRTKCDLDGIVVEMKSGGKRSLSPLT